MSDWKPLWNWYGDRRHIAVDPPQTRYYGGRMAWRSLCGQYMWTGQDLREAGRSDDRMDSAPLCKVCAKKEGIEPTLLTQADYRLIYDAVNEYISLPDEKESGWTAEQKEAVLRKVEGYL